MSDAQSCQTGSTTTAAQPAVDADVMKAFPGRPSIVAPNAALSALSYKRAADAALVDQIVAFIGERLVDLEKIGVKGLVVGLSGGVDSIVCLELCRRAVPVGLLKAVTVLAGDDAEVQRLRGLSECARKLGIENVFVDGRAAQAALTSAWPEIGPWSSINILTRLVHGLIFQVADSLRSGVCATTDRSEDLLGRYTELFYGQVAPLAHLYKTEVTELARFLGVAHAVESVRPGCESHWYDDTVLGAGYDMIDPLLHLMVEHKLPDGDIARRYGVDDLQWLSRLRRRLDNQSARILTYRLQRGGLPALSGEHGV